MKIIIISGLKRSGSTLCFNIVRSILKSNGRSFSQEFCKDVKDFTEVLDASNSNDIFVCKTHDFKVVEFAKSRCNDTLNITTYRNLDEIAASGIAKFNWSNENALINLDMIVNNWAYAKKRNLLGELISYKSLNADIKKTIDKIAKYLNIDISNQEISNIVRIIENQKDNMSNVNKLTLLKRRFFFLLNFIAFKFPILKTSLNIKIKNKLKYFLTSGNPDTLLHSNHITGSNPNNLEFDLREEIHRKYNAWQQRNFK